MKWNFSTNLDHLNVSEELPEFSSVIPLSQSQLIRGEHRYYEKKYGFKIMPDHVEKLLVER